LFNWKSPIVLGINTIATFIFLNNNELVLRKSKCGGGSLKISVIMSEPGIVTGNGVGLRSRI
jgi:hypothetical protein